MDINPKQFMEAIDQIADERKIPKERILETVEAAIAAAYRKDFGHPEQQVRATLNPDSGETELYLVYDIVAKQDDVENEQTEITVTEARKKGAKSPKAGEEYVEPLDVPEGFGRIAAQTAKQVIIQRIREVEREIVREEFTDRVGELMTGSVQRVEGRNVFVEVGRAIGVMGPDGQIEHERYYIGQRLRVMLKEVDPEARAAQLILTRSDPDFVRRLFELEVPEIHAGTVEIKSVAREAGVRTKVAVASNQEGVDPVGTCVGQRGTRVQAIMAELGDEKIDIVLFDEDPVTYITNALSPAKISRIDLDESTRTASIHVADDQLSLAIGRGGQNVRLAGDLTGWQLDIEKSDAQKKAEAAAKAAEEGDSGSGVVASIPIAGVEGVTEAEATALDAVKLGTAQQVAAATDEEIAKADGIEGERIREIQQAAAQAVSEIDDAPAEGSKDNSSDDAKADDTPAKEPAEDSTPEAPAEESKDEAPATEAPAADGTAEPAATTEAKDDQPTGDASADPSGDQPEEKSDDKSVTDDKEADPEKE